MCGPVTVPTTLASTPKCPSASSSAAAVFSWPVVSGLAAAAVERVSSLDCGTRQSKPGSSVTALCGAARPATGSGASSRRVTPGSSGSAPRRAASASSGSSACSAPRPRALLGRGRVLRRPALRAAEQLGEARGGVERRRLDVRGLDHQLAVPGLRRRQRLARGVGAGAPPRRCSAALSSVVESRSARPVPTRPVRSACTTPAIVAPVSSSSAASEEEQGDDVGAQALDRGRGGRVERLAHDPAARLDERAAPLVRARAARPQPERPGGERQRERREQAQRAGGERAAVGQERPQHDDRPAGHQRGGHDVGDHADEVAEAVGQRPADLAPVPVAVEDERQEHAQRDEREPDEVQLALLEHGQAQPQPGAVAPRRAALRGLLRRLPGSLATRSSCARPSRLHPFDGHAGDPAAPPSGRGGLEPLRPHA